MDKKASYRTMESSVPEDWALVSTYSAQNRQRIPDEIFDLLERLKTKEDGSPISGYDHSLQSATLAHNDGADEETVFIALLHDIGQIHSAAGHSEVSAAMLRPYISEKNYWIVKHHGEFQGYYFWHHMGMDQFAREKYKDHPYYQDCIDWCHKYDQCAFDPDYENKPLAFFEPLVRRIMAREPWSALEEVA